MCLRTVAGGCSSGLESMTRRARSPSSSACANLYLSLRTGGALLHDQPVGHMVCTHFARKIPRGSPQWTVPIFVPMLLQKRVLIGRNR